MAGGRFYTAHPVAPPTESDFRGGTNGLRTRVEAFVGLKGRRMRESFPVALVWTGLMGSGGVAHAQDVPACCQGDARAAAILAAAHRASPEQPAAEKRETESQPALSTADWPAKPWPEGMVWVPTGEFTMGAVKGDTDAKPDESPAHRVRVTGFWMDQTEVTVGQFKAFVAATKYITIAERKPDLSLIHI